MQNASSFKRDEFKRNDFTQAVIAKKQSKVVKKICHDSSILSIDSAALGLKNYVMFEEFIISRNEGSSMNYIKALRNAEQRFKCFILENNPPQDSTLLVDYENHDYVVRVKNQMN